MSATDPPAGPAPGVAAWVPDPGGRHQFRWWDGRAYTAVVADDGVRAVDPLPATPPAPTAPPVAPAAPAAAPWAQPWSPGPFTAPGAAPGLVPGPAQGPAQGPVPAGTGGRRARVLVVAVVAALAVAAVVVVAGTGTFEGDDGGTGTFEGRASTDEPGTHDLSVGPGQVLLATVSPDADLDAVVGLLVDDRGADHLDDLFGGVAAVGDAAGAFGDGVADALAALDRDRDGGARAVAWRTDLDFAGGEETVLLVAAEELDATLVVAPFGDESGTYTVEVERLDLELDEEALGDADGRELLDAVIDAGAPPRFTELARDLLELLDEQEEAAGEEG